MKNVKYLLLACLGLLSLGFTSCNDDDDYFSDDAQKTTIVVNKIYLEDADASVTDREVTFARLGQIIRIEGSGFVGVRHVYINGYDTYFNRAYVSNVSMMVQLDSDTPISDADDDVRNTIRLTKDNTETTVEFDIRASSPTVSNISNTLPKAGETVVVSGTNLHETYLAVLPDGTEITDITNDEDGKWYSFVMPAGVSAVGGSIISYGANGTAQTPACFNEQGCIILDFDGNGDFGAWSATYQEEDLATDPLNSGRGIVCPAIPQSAVDDGGIQPGAHGNGWFTAGNDTELDDWSRFYGVIPSDTPVEELAFQFDVYVPDAWTTGMLEFTFQNNLSTYGYGSTETQNTTNITYPTAVVWVPWLVDGAVVPYSTSGWETITIPLSTVGKYQNADAGYTFADVVNDRNNGSYRNFGMFLVNSDIEYSEDLVFEATQFSQMIYTDSWRLVPYKSYVVSDYDDEE